MLIYLKGSIQRFQTSTESKDLKCHLKLKPFLLSRKFGPNKKIFKLKKQTDELKIWVLSESMAIRFTF